MRLKNAARAACLLAALVLTRVPAGADEATDAIDKAHDAYISALEFGNASKLADLFTDDATLLPSNSVPVRGRVAIRAMYERLFRTLRITEGSLRTQDLVRRGDIIYDTGEYNYDFDNGGKYSHSTGRYLNVWRRVAGVWKIDLTLGQQDAPVR